MHVALISRRNRCLTTLEIVAEFHRDRLRKVSTVQPRLDRLIYKDEWPRKHGEFFEHFLNHFIFKRTILG
ncbi:hypothetical protein QE152_g8234 [Popillia japonica]|uniref:Uncharacterized protein n=1 Tax=Popillia japonica TaxID=7064 RepID=A0AAW1MDJ4_POPJA